MAETGKSGKGSGYAFGTFGGVFTPSILTIFGLIMFMRANYVVGNAGIVHSLIILALSTGISLLTGLSLSAISTNTPVAGGGAYFLISRVLGPSFGTAIGLALFVAQALSVPFYILGFSEALLGSFPVPAAYFRAACLITVAVLFVVTWVGADFAIKCQYVILGILGLAIVFFLVGAGLRFNAELFWANATPHYAEGANFWSMFAIYFPAVTGIMAGVNMSGDLKNPARSIPLGALAAISLSFLVYGAQIMICGGAADASTLRARPYLLLVEHAWLGAGFLVVAGVFTATLSSAIGSFLGAPRVLQAVARDKALRSLTPFAAGSGKGDDPRRALLATLGIALVTLLLAGAAEGGKGLNLVAAIVSMVFLYTYGMTNLAAFVESFGANPSFRPRFKYFHWTTALAGTLACVWAAVQINAIAAVLAAALVGALFLVARKREMTQAYGDARRGFLYQRVRRNLWLLSTMRMHPKNWRPTVLVLSGNPHARIGLVTYAQWIGMRRGIVSLVSLLVGDLADLREERRKEAQSLRKFVDGHQLQVFPEVFAVSDFDRDLRLLLQTYSIGPIKPNIVLFGWPRERERLDPYFQHLRTVADLSKSIIVVLDRGVPFSRPQKRIDCWWRGRANGSLMLILAHLIMQNSDWKGTRLRLLRSTGDASRADAAREDLENICHAARIEADIAVPITDKPFADVLREHSEDASLILLGFTAPAPESQREYHARIESLLTEMPSTLLIHSNGDADLLA